MKKSSYKERERGRRESEILIEAARLIRASGFADLNMDTLAETVGISKPTLYQHFKNKEDLIAQVIGRGLEELENYLASTSHASPLDRLTMAVRMLLYNRYAHDGKLVGITPEMIYSTLRTHEDILARRERVMTILRALIDEGKARGEIVHNVATPMISGMVFNIMGLLPHYRVEFMHESMNPDELDTAIRQALFMFRRSIAQHPTS